MIFAILFKTPVSMLLSLVKIVSSFYSPHFSSNNNPKNDQNMVSDGYMERKKIKCNLENGSMTGELGRVCKGQTSWRWNQVYPSRTCSVVWFQIFMKISKMNHIWASKSFRCAAESLVLTVMGIYNWQERNFDSTDSYHASCDYKFSKSRQFLFIVVQLSTCEWKVDGRKHYGPLWKSLKFPQND